MKALSIWPLIGALAGGAIVLNAHGPGLTMFGLSLAAYVGLGGMLLASLLGRRFTPLWKVQTLTAVLLAIGIAIVLTAGWFNFY